MSVAQQVKLLGYRAFPRRFAKLYWDAQRKRGNRVGEVFDYYIKPGGQVMDVGASLGVFSVRFLETVGSNGRVHALEPQTSAADSLRRLTKLFSNFSFDGIAVSDTAGEAQMAVPIFGGTADHGRASLQTGEAKQGEAKHIAVRTATLDSVVQDHGLRPDFIKIDVEGFEYEVLNGGRATLETCRPTMLIEIVEQFRPERFDATFSLLNDLNYQVYALAHNGLLPMDQFDKDRDQTPFASDPQLGSDERFIYDFLAVPVEHGQPSERLFR